MTRYILLSMFGAYGVQYMSEKNQTKPYVFINTSTYINTYTIQTHDAFENVVECA